MCKNKKICQKTQWVKMITVIKIVLLCFLFKNLFSFLFCTSVVKYIMKLIQMFCKNFLFLFLQVLWNILWSFVKYIMKYIMKLIKKNLKTLWKHLVTYILQNICHECKSLVSLIKLFIDIFKFIHDSVSFLFWYGSHKSQFKFLYFCWVCLQAIFYTIAW